MKAAKPGSAAAGKMRSLTALLIVRRGRLAKLRNIGEATTSGEPFEAATPMEQVTDLPAEPALEHRR